MSNRKDAMFAFYRGLNIYCYNVNGKCQVTERMPTIFANVCFVFVHWFTLLFIFTISFRMINVISDVTERFIFTRKSVANEMYFADGFCAKCRVMILMKFATHRSLLSVLKFQQKPLISLNNIESDCQLFISNAN